MSALWGGTPGRLAEPLYEVRWANIGKQVSVAIYIDAAQAERHFFNVQADHDMAQIWELRGETWVLRRFKS